MARRRVHYLLGIGAVVFALGLRGLLWFLVKSMRMGMYTAKGSVKGNDANFKGLELTLPLIVFGCRLIMPRLIPILEKLFLIHVAMCPTFTRIFS
jgi:hypothetical protein